MDELLAIIIPYYKLTFFEDTLISISKQTNKKFKVYIGDDASPENPQDLLSAFEGRFEFYYHRFDTNLGGTSLAMHWERCIELVENPQWIILLGDDDVLGDQVVESFYEALQVFEGKTHLVRFSSSYIRDKHVAKHIFTQPQWENAYDSYYRRLAEGGRSTLSEYVFSYNQYTKYGFKDYPLGWHSDDMAWLEFSDGLPIYSMNKAQVFIRLSKLNISSKQDNLMEKQRASLLFFRELVEDKLMGFSKLQRKKLLLHYEKVIFMQKQLSFRNINFLLWYYLKRGEFYSLWKLNKNLVRRVMLE